MRPTDGKADIFGQDSVNESVESSMLGVRQFFAGFLPQIMGILEFDPFAIHIIRGE